MLRAVCHDSEAPFSQQGGASALMDLAKDKDNRTTVVTDFRVRRLKLEIEKFGERLRTVRRLRFVFSGR